MPSEKDKEEVWISAAPKNKVYKPERDENRPVTSSKPRSKLMGPTKAPRKEEKKEPKAKGTRVPSKFVPTYKAEKLVSALFKAAIHGGGGNKKV